MDININIIVTDERKNEMTVDNDITVEDMMEDRRPTMRELKSLISVFVADETGRYLPQEKSLAVLGQVKNKDFEELVANPFAEAWKNSLVPLSSEENSSQPSTGADVDHGG